MVLRKLELSGFSRQSLIRKQRFKNTKEYSQQHGIGYSEVFAIVAMWDTIF